MALTFSKAASLVGQFDKACEAYYFRGTQHPADISDITEEYNLAKDRLMDALTKPIKQRSK